MTSNQTTIRSGNAVIIPRPNAGEGKRSEDSNAAQIKRKAPPRAKLNRIPTPERLEALIKGALTALRQGTFWDRGSIVNIVL